MIHEGKHYGTGAIPSIADERDFLWHEVAHGSAPFDWTAGYDVETLIFDLAKIGTKDQGQSGSCGGQAWAYYDAAIEALSTKTYEERSARFIYSQTFVPGGGSDGRTNCELVKSKGDAREAVFTSYENGSAPSEAFMEKHSDITSAVLTDAAKGMTLGYALVPSVIDTVAQAVRDNGGVIIGIAGSNNGTWLSPNPQHPVKGEDLWYHWLYVGKARIHNGVKQVGVHNSWGSSVGESGWQWINEDYFTGGWIFEVWSMIFNPNGAPVIFHHTFNVDLEYGQTSDEVKALQTALQTDGSFPSTVVPTRYYGTVTRTAVQKFQVKYGIAKAGDAGYGRCGPKTRAKLNSIFG